MLNETATRFARASFKLKLVAGLLFFQVAEGFFGGSNRRCYHTVGCFIKGDNLTLPYRFPSSPESVGTKFNLYSRQHKEKPVEISESLPKETLNSYFGTKKDLVFIVHGFGQGEHSTMPIEMKDAFLEKIDCNFVIVLWTRGARKPLYNIAAANTALVGRQIALLLRKLTEEFPETVLSPEVHLIGFSLGAHAAGFCGRYFTLITNKTIGRITDIGCSHRRSAEYFVESLTNRNCKFVSYSCTNGLQDRVSACKINQSDHSVMGYYSKDALGRGAQMLPTKSRSPYCERW
uniref:Putative phospholipase n=1 Tax=Ixodes ricinus TaxID=34613 RepID=A0A147BRZ5_IXORI